MRVHEFALVLAAAPEDELADRLYGVFQDGTISESAGVAIVTFHREASSLEQAIQTAVKDVQSCGVGIRRIELEPQSVAPAV